MSSSGPGKATIVSPVHTWIHIWLFFISFVLQSQRCWCFTPHRQYDSCHRRTNHNSELFFSAASPQNAVVAVNGNLDTDFTGDDLSAFQVLAGNIGLCLIASDLKRDTGFDGASTGWTSWVDEATAIRLQCCMDALSLSIPKNPDDPTHVDLLEKRDEAFRWTRWMKGCPSPMVVEMSTELRQAVNDTINDVSMQRVDSTREAFLERIGCRVILLPSGAELRNHISTPPGAMAYGKLLFGGAKRYRLIGASKRRAGERTLIYEPKAKSWLQYGGPDRNYEAIDMGPCALAEVVLLPKGLSLPLLSQEGHEMSLSQFRWDPCSMFEFFQEEEREEIVEEEESEGLVDFEENVLGDLSGKDHIDNLESTFTSSVGGLHAQIQAIVRRVLDGRVVQPINELNSGGEKSAANDKQRVKEAETLAALGLQPVRGLLLYGPPGCGKTVLAREISRCLDARPPKIVAAPELLDRWVGGSEKLVRELFADAEAELTRCNGDPTKSALHVVVIDEIDAVFRRRTGGEDSGEATRASAVNQILAKLDGVNALGNVLLIGMTNRRELLDEALLRPGRLEVQVKIPLPDREGRSEILRIHFEKLRRKGRLSQPLCEAIDGVRKTAEGDGDSTLFRWPRYTQKSLHVGRRKIRDLAASQWTGGFSGADIAGLVRCAGSIALARARMDGGGVENLLITVEDIVDALAEVKR